jgi:hypothetical protein
MLKEIIKTLQGFQMMEQQDSTAIYMTWFGENQLESFCFA